MTSYVPPEKNAEYIFYISLRSQADAKIMQANPTIAAGDFKVSIDGGTLANLTNLPAVTPASSKMVKLILIDDEMNGDNVTVVCSDASGSEWCDLTINLQTSARQVDDLAFPNTSGRGIDVTTGGGVGIDWANVENPTTTLNLSGTTVKEVTDVETKLGTPAGASVSADIAAIEAQTDDIGVAGAGLTNIPAGTASPDVLITTTITNLISQQLFDLTAGSADDNAYNGMTVVITDASNPNQKAIGEVLAHAGAGPTISLKEDPAIFTIANGDTISILADRSLKPTVHGRTLDLTTGGNAGVDWANVANPTTTLGLTGTTLKLTTAGIDEILDDLLADSIPADGSLPTVRQALYMITQFLYERAVSGTTMTVKKVDGTTALLTLTLNDATTPTSITRAT